MNQKPGLKDTRDERIFTKKTHRSQREFGDGGFEASIRKSPQN